MVGGFYSLNGFGVGFAYGEYVRYSPLDELGDSVVQKQWVGEAIASSQGDQGWGWARQALSLALGTSLGLALAGTGLTATYGTEVTLSAPMQTNLGAVGTWVVPTIVESQVSAGLAASGSVQSDVQEVAQQPSQIPLPSASLKDGVYVYGQNNQPNQLGHTYLVFEARQGKVTGAFYMPHSSFDCFYGQLQADRMALTVIDSYDQNSHDYAIALDRTYTAGRQGTGTQFALEGFQPLATVSTNDQRMLKVCQAATR
jgi:hypothetical protein